jgi:hypothetical protein
MELRDEYRSRDLTPCILTAAVFEADVFDKILASIVQENDEGTIIMSQRSNGIVGLPLIEAEVRELMGSAKLDPPIAALLHLALQHRRLLLSALPAPFTPSKARRQQNRHR